MRVAYPIPAFFKSGFHILWDMTMDSRVGVFTLSLKIMEAITP
jgi:hypothetical protein